MRTKLLARKMATAISKRCQFAQRRLAVHKQPMRIYFSGKGKKGGVTCFIIGREGGRVTSN